MKYNLQILMKYIKSNYHHITVESPKHLINILNQDIVMILIVITLIKCFHVKYQLDLFYKIKIKLNYLIIMNNM